MANPFAKLFGFGTPSTQQRPSERPLLAQDTRLFAPTAQSIEEALGRRGTGFTPDLFTQSANAARNIGRRELDTQLAAGGATASARGLGRSSVVQSQDTAARRQLGESLAAQDAELRRQSQLAEISQQQQARGLGLQGTQLEGSLAQNRATFEQNVFDKQEADRARQDQEQQAGLMRSLMLGGGALGGAFGLLPGTAAGGFEGAGLGALAGLQGDLGAFKPAGKGLFEGANIFPDAGDAGSVDVGQTRDKLAAEYRITRAQLDAILDGE